MPPGLGRHVEARYRYRMKARRVPAATANQAHTADPNSSEAAWRTDELPESLQDELGVRLHQAERGVGLLPYDDALAEVDRMVEEILAVGAATSR